jgi:alpha-ketoglutarate-dependent taurine dioxygenase
MTWQEAFQETDRGRVEDYCRAAGIELSWRPNGVLRTRQVRPAVAVHPRTREPVWFNHAVFFHVLSLAPVLREMLLGQVVEADLPSNTYYGDGGPIEPETIAALRDAYAAELVTVPWREGDVLLVDNVLVAHGREPFTGPRRVVVSMAGTLRHDGLPSFEEAVR